MEDPTVLEALIQQLSTRESELVDGLAAEALMEAHQVGLLHELRPLIDVAVRAWEIERIAWEAPPVIGRPPTLPSWETALMRRKDATRALERIAPSIRQALKA